MKVSDLFHSGTTSYCPPEWVSKQQYLGGDATVWSLGLLLFQLVHGRLPFRIKEEITESQVPLSSALSEGKKMKKNHIYTWIIKL